MKKLLCLACMLSVVTPAFAVDNGDTRTAVSGAIGGALGSVIGQQVGGQAGAAIGAGLGGAAGGALGAERGSRNEAAIGAGLGAAGGQVLGSQIGGGTGGAVGAAAGAAAGGSLGNQAGANDRAPNGYNRQPAYPPRGYAPRPEYREARYGNERRDYRHDNRRRFDEVLESEWQRAHRSKTPLSLLMLDVDHFKRLNDTHGHPFGDEVLKRLASILAHRIQRTGSLVARYGGEEFAVLLPDTDLPSAAKLAEFIRQQVENMSLGNENTGLVRITISIGVACASGTALTASTTALVDMADRALYQAKRSGRNQVAAATP